MTATRDIDRLLDQWFGIGPDIAPPRAVEEALRIVDATPQALPGPRGLVPGALRGPALMPAFRLAAVAAMVVALLLAMLALGGGRPSDLTFASERYRYTIEHSAEWTVTPATEGWGVTEPWDATPWADVFRRDGMRFSVVATAIVGRPTVDHWADVFVPDRPELAGRLADRWCVDPASSSTPAIQLAAYRGWQATRIAGADGVIRVACGYVDAVMLVGQRAYVVSMFTGRQALADLSAFDDMVRTLALAPDPPPAPVAPRTDTPPPTPEPDDTTFESALYDYRLAHPASWDIEPATERWTGSGELEAPVADRFGTRGGLFIAALDLEDGVTVEAWLADHVPPPARYDDGYCKYGTFTGMTMIPGAGAGWYDDEVGGRPARKRVMCGYIHAAVGVGRRVYVLQLFTGRQPGGDTAAFDAATDGIDFSPQPDDPSATLDPDATVEFVSPRYGYRATAPGHWALEPATMSLDDLRPVRSFGPDPTFDRFLDGAFRMIFAASAPVPAGTTVSAWVEEHAPSRQTLDPGGDAWQCRGPNGGVWMHIPYAGWRSWQVDGHEALARDSCFFFDVVTIVGDRAYHFTARSGTVIGTSNAAPAYLDAFLDTVEFTPETAIDE